MLARRIGDTGQPASRTYAANSCPGGALLFGRWAERLQCRIDAQIRRFDDLTARSIQLGAALIGLTLAMSLGSGVPDVRIPQVVSIVAPLSAQPLAEHVIFLPVTARARAIGRRAVPTASVPSATPTPFTSKAVATQARPGPLAPADSVYAGCIVTVWERDERAFEVQKVKTRIHDASGAVVRNEWDTNADGEAEYLTLFEYGEHGVELVLTDSDGDGDLDYRSRYTYHPNGAIRLIESVDLIGPARVFRWHFGYDDRGRMSAEFTEAGGSGKVSATHFFYDEGDRLVEYISDSDGDGTFERIALLEWGPYGLVRDEVKAPGGAYISHYLYDTDGRYIGNRPRLDFEDIMRLEIHYGADGWVSDVEEYYYSRGEVPDYHREYGNDSKGRPTTMWLRGDGFLLEVHEYRYDCPE